MQCCTSPGHHHPTPPLHPSGSEVQPLPVMRWMVRRQLPPGRSAGVGPPSEAAPTGLRCNVARKGNDAVKINVFDGLTAPCCWDGTANAGDPCACGADERILRGYADRLPSLPPMTPEQRAWCLDEIGSVEGYERRDYEGYPDHDLAHAVLCAWIDYCRDKGML